MKKKNQKKNPKMNPDEVRPRRGVAIAIKTTYGLYCGYGLVTI